MARKSQRQSFRNDLRSRVSFPTIRRVCVLGIGGCGEGGWECGPARDSGEGGVGEPLVSGALRVLETSWIARAPRADDESTTEALHVPDGDRSTVVFSYSTRRCTGEPNTSRRPQHQERVQWCARESCTGGQGHTRRSASPVWSARPPFSSSCGVLLFCVCACRTFAAVASSRGR